MFTPASRYFNLPTRIWTRINPDGTRSEIRYVARRVVPAPSPPRLLMEHTVRAGERIDHVADSHIGDATQAWRIADANLAMYPLDLTAVAGRRIRIEIAQE